MVDCPRPQPQEFELPLSTDVWWRRIARVDEIDVLHVDLSPNATLESLAYDWLDGAERSRWQRFAFPGPKRRFALCRAALRRILCERLDCVNDQLTFEEAERGKPYAVIDGEVACVSFNVSHSGRHGLIAVASSGRIGVDVEERVDNRHIDLISEAVFGPNERRELAAVKGQEKIATFFHLWTVKESLIKAIGAGFSLDPSTFEVPRAMRHSAKSSGFEFPQFPGEKWRIVDLSNDEFAAALAYGKD